MWKIPKRPSPQKATRARVNGLAIALLEAAVAEAKERPIERTVGHRLALAWLSFTEVAAPHDTVSFWDCLGHQGYYTSERGTASRDLHARCFLETWRKRIEL